MADYNGKPHYFESEWSDMEDDYADTFLLSPIGQKVLLLALEDWRIWLRWQTAFTEGRTDMRTHPALPEDRERHGELEPILKDALRINLRRVICATAVFQEDEDRNEPYGLLVEWTTREITSGFTSRQTGAGDP